MNAIICFIIGFILAKLFNYITIRKELANNKRFKPLNIGDSNDVIEVTSGMMVIEIDTPSSIHNFDFENMNNIIFYISSTNEYIHYKDNNFRYVKLDTPIR